ncbi:MAG: hypothetical protein NT106_12645, partial [Candidatus Sumerlaeota bacterium]|nr:hypothetical protein [Candidatus Sumerlaeota bacterium]
HLLGLDPASVIKASGGIFLSPPEVSGLVSVSGAKGEEERLMQILIDVRRMARENKEFKMADEIRDRLSTMGISLEDHPQGTIWKRK